MHESEGEEEKGESDAKGNHLLENKDLYLSGTVKTITSPIENILVSLYKNILTFHAKRKC